MTTLPGADFQLIARDQHEIEPDIRLLDAAETARYQRFLLPQRQQEFLTGRTLLKNLLSEYLGIRPTAIICALSPKGKPYLPDTYGVAAPQFSLAHSGGRYLVGLSAHPIGVDLERPCTVEVKQYRHFLSEREQQQLAALPEPARSTQFYRLFTQKEAFLKATDKRWPLAESSFYLTSGQWQLDTQQADYAFYQAESAGYSVAACLQISSLR